MAKAGTTIIMPIRIRRGTGHKWWELDASWLTIRLLMALGSAPRMSPCRLAALAAKVAAESAVNFALTAGQPRSIRVPLMRPAQLFRQQMQIAVIEPELFERMHGREHIFAVRA